MLSKNYKKIIDNIFITNKLVHCYLLNNFSKSSNDDALLYFLNKFDENNYITIEKEKMGENIYLIDSDEKTIKKEEILEAFQDANSTMISTNKTKIIIIKNIENASVNGINSILKIIEEPIKNLIILLTTDAISRVLPTIKSRSQVINIFSDSKAEIFNNLVVDNNHKTLSWVLSNITSDLSYAQLFYDVNFSEYLYKIMENVQNSWKNKHILYSFLYDNLTSDNNNRNFFTLYSLTYFYKLLVTDILGPIESRIKGKLLPANKIIPNNILELNTFVFDVNKFFSNINNRGLVFSLQKEILLIKLMELYG